MKNFFYLILFFNLIVLVSGCKKDDDNPSPSGSNGNKITVTIQGFVKNKFGFPIPGAMVTAGNKTVITNGWGIYYIENAEVNDKRCVITVTKNSYLKQQKAIVPKSGAILYADIFLFDDHQSYSFNSSSGYTVSLNGDSEIIFPADAFVTASGTPYSGAVKVTAHAIYTDNPDFGKIIPGGDLLARDINNETTMLTSFGMAGAEIYDNAGNRLKLAPGKTAQIRFSITAAQSGSAPPTIALWHFDEAESIWKEEGTATRNGNYYEANVSHFSWWNCDYPCEYTYLTMNVVDCSGFPLANYVIELTDQNSGQATIGYTNSNGSCSGIIPANVLINVEIRNLQNSSIIYQGIIGPFATNSTMNIISVAINPVNCSGINGQITNCQGNNISATVVLTNNNMPVAAQTVVNGNFSFTNLSPGTYTLYAYSGIYSGNYTIIIPGSGQQVITGNISLCDSVAMNNPVNFIINSAINGTVICPVNVVSTHVIDSISYSIIKINHQDSLSGWILDLEFMVDQYSPGTYAWNINGSLIGYINYAGDLVQLYSQTGSLTLTATPAVGGNIEGVFNGTLIIDPLLAGEVVSVNGSFSVQRDL